MVKSCASVSSLHTNYSCGQETWNFRGKCKVNWIKTTLPKGHEGLSVLNLDKFATALCIKWLWHEWVSLDKTMQWKGTSLNRCGRARQSILEMVERLTFGLMLGYREGNQGMFCWAYSPEWRGTTRWWLLCYTMLIGLETSTTALTSCSISLMQEYFTLWNLTRKLELHPT